MTTWRLEGDCSFLEHEDGGSKLFRNLSMCQSIWRYMSQPWIFVNTVASTTTPEFLSVLQCTVLSEHSSQSACRAGEIGHNWIYKCGLPQWFDFLKRCYGHGTKWGRSPTFLQNLTSAVCRSVADGQPARSWANYVELPANYRLPALNHRHCPPGAPHACVSDWSNQLYTLTHRVRHMPLTDFGQF
jgi:hypothetical protein